MSFILNTQFERPSPELVARAARLNTGIAGFTAGMRQVMHGAIKPLRPEWTICGPAFTIKLEFTDDHLLCELAGKYLQPGDVVVVDGGARTDVGIWGAGTTRGARLAGARGVVLDGAATNSQLITEVLGLPVFARGLVAGAGPADRPGWMNVPVVCGGVVVSPGDIVLGDRDGVVVIPRERAEAIVTRAAEATERAAGRRDTGVPYYVAMNSEAKLARLDVEVR